MTRFVLDASVALSWFVDNPVPHSAIIVREALLRGSLASVPSLWGLEMANGLLVAQRRQTIDHDQTANAISQLESLLASAIKVETDLVSIKELFSTAKAYLLTAYDAVYLDLARRNALPLASLDKSLRSAARRAGVPIFS